MRFNEAQERVAARSAAALGKPHDCNTEEMFHVHIRPADLSRRLLSGSLDGEELDAAVIGMGSATMNTLKALAVCDEDTEVMASLYGAFTQVLLLGILLGGRPHDDTVERRPSSDFPGAVE